MFTYYETNYLIILKWINTLTPADTPQIYIPMAFGLTLTFKLSMIVFGFQWIFFMLLVMWRDNSMSESFKKKDKQTINI